MMQSTAYRIKGDYTIQLPHRRLLRGGEILESPSPELVRQNAWKLEPVKTENPALAPVSPSPDELFQEWMKEQTISIIIPAWKAANFLEECLDSLIVQNPFRLGIKYEILLGIDGCKSTRRRALKIAKQYYGLLQVRWFSKNYGPYVVKNSLTVLAKNEWCLFFDADDTAEPEMLESLLRSQWEQSGAAIYMMGQDSNEEIKQTCGVFLISRDTFLELGGFYAWRCAADTEFMKRLETVGIKKVCQKDILMNRRIHENQITVKSDTGFGSELRAGYMKKIRTNQKAGIAKIKLVTAMSEKLV